MPLGPRKKAQHAREQQRANQQNRNTHRSRVTVQSSDALRVLHQGVQEVDRDDQEAGDGEGDERAGV